jgi:hypothetical protein
LTYRDATSDYRVVISADGLQSETVIVGEPKYLAHAVDSSEAFDEAARAAISFAETTVGCSSVSYDDHGPFVSRKRSSSWVCRSSARPFSPATDAPAGALNPEARR